MKRQLYQMGGLSSLYNNSGGQKPIYPRISQIESSLSNAEQRIGDPSLGSSSGTSDGGFSSPMGGVYSQSTGGELPPIQQAMAQGPLQIPSTLINPVRDGVDTSQLGSPRSGSYIDFGQITNPDLQNVINTKGPIDASQLGSPRPGSYINTPIQQSMAQGPLQIPSTLINPVRDGVDTSQLGSPRPGSYVDFGQIPRQGIPREPGTGISSTSLFGGVGDPRSGAPDVANSLQQIMRGGAANGGLMNRQLYANGTGIAELLKMNQGAAQDELTEEQAFALMPEGVKEAFASMLEAGASPEEARRLISEQIAEMSRQSAMMSEQQMQGESQNIPEYYDSRLQILNPEQMREEMQNPSMPIRPDMAGGGIMNLPMDQMMVPRGEYGFGSIVKSVGKAIKGATKAVTSFAKSDIGKAALLAAVGFGIPGTQFGGLFGRAGFGGAATGLFGQQGLGATLGAAKTGLGTFFGKAATGEGLSSLIPGKGTLLSLGAGFLGGAAGSMLTPEQIQTGMKRDPAAVRGYLAQYYKNANPEATESEAEQYALEQTREYAAQGGRIGLAMGTMPMGEPRQNPQGIMELDYRQEGGFVPVGIKEKADDVPAMLSKNEFVFTADAVRNAGDGDVEKGAQRLYNTMKTLENGGMV
jgi:hypothetical protein